MTDRFVLVFAFADDDVLDALPVAVLLLVDGVLFVQLLALVLRDVVQGVLVDHPHTVVLRPTPHTARQNEVSNEHAGELYNLRE